MAGIWVLGDKHNETLELLNIGQELASYMGNKVTAILNHIENAQDYIDYGADEVIMLPALPEGCSLEAFVPAIAEEVIKEDPDIFLVTASIRGKEIAARLAAHLNTGLCSECFSIKYDEAKQQIEMQRLIYGGAAIQTVVCPTRPQMATIAPGRFPASARQASRQGEIRHLAAVPTPMVKVIERKAKVNVAGELTQSRIVIGIGRGIEKSEDIYLVQELAQRIGAEIGCTRPISEELHWMPGETCIGLSGVQVKPDIYIGIGISGQIQHMVGIRDAKIICAINQDENAPIFSGANYGIVGDLYQIIPALIEELGK